jgi:pimeloyl-ACP methyl ester carboxylesterase
VDELHACGALPGHAQALRSLCLQWRSWIDARASYSAIGVPVTLVYGDSDWSYAEDREANAREIPGAQMRLLEQCGHFSCLEKPGEVAELIHEACA